MMGCTRARCSHDGERQRGASVSGESIGAGRAVVAGVFSHVDPPLQHKHTRVQAEVGRGCLSQSPAPARGGGSLSPRRWLPKAGPVPSFNMKHVCLIINVKVTFFITISPCNQLSRWSYLIRTLVQRLTVSPAARLNQIHPQIKSPI